MAYNTPVLPKWYHYVLIFPLFIIIRIWQASIFFRIDSKSREILSSSMRMIGLAWHDTIFFLPMSKWSYRPKFPMSGLVSASRDGSYLCAYFKFCGIKAIRGSSRGRAAASLLGLIEAIKNGSDIFITPDGPLGPRHRAKAGFVGVSKETGARIALMHIAPRRFVRLKTWDGFMLPLPFTKVDISAFEFSSAEELLSAASSAGSEPAAYVGRFLSRGSFEISSADDRSHQTAGKK